METSGLSGARAIAMLCVVIGHALLPFMETPIGWAIQFRSRHILVDLVVWTVHAFVMPAFFWLAGHAAAGHVARGGLRGLALNRLARVALPLAVLLVPTSLALNTLWDWGRRVEGGRDRVAAQLPALRASELPVTLGHLWFLYYLLLLSAVAGVVVLLARRRATVSAWLPVAAVLPVAALLWNAGKLRLDTPLSFAIDPTIAAFYGVFFAWGWILRGRPQVLEAYARHAWLLVAAALALVALLVPALREARPPLGAIVASAALSLTATAAFLGLCVRHAARPNAALAYLARASYWCYLVHLPVVVFLQVAFAARDVPPPLALAAIVAGTFAICLPSYELVRRAAVMIPRSAPTAGR